MTDSKYHDRQNLEFFRWPELLQRFQSLVELVMVTPGNLSRQLRSELFTMASLAGGCQHCQAHGAYTLHMMGVDPDRIRDIWRFEQSAQFSEAERAALRLAGDGALVPNMVEPGHFAELRRHYSDRQIVEMLAVISLAGWYNRWNNSIATVTDRESAEWAEANLKAVGWKLGKHAGADHEQRRRHPRSTDPDRIEY
ncbi:MAG: carboxymuconolactone decarboxylase family protein [Betaproteobacteria bacterium]|nr:MAG: carboxymuconolactone decarboxylase family protein [Betaproteobacteria bacterium]